MPRTSEANQPKSEFCCDRCDKFFEKERQLELHQSLNEFCLKLKAECYCPICHSLDAKEQDRKVYKTVDDFQAHLKESQSVHIEQLAIENVELKYKVEAKDIQVEQLARENVELKDKVEAKDIQVEQLARENVELKDKVGAKDIQVEQLARENVELKDKVGAKDIQVEQLAREYVELKDKVRAKDFQVEQLARENVELNDKVGANDFQVSKDELEKELNKMLESFRKNLEEERSKFELLPGNIERVDAIVKYVQYESTVLHDNRAEIERLNSYIDDLIQKSNRLSGYIRRLEHDVEELNCRLYNVENIRYDGTAVFKVSRQRMTGFMGTQECLCSSIFYTSPGGYKLKCQVFVNRGDPGTREYLTLSFVVMKGEFDDILEWPLNRNVTARVKCIKDQSQDLVYTLTAENNSFQKPQSEENAPIIVPQLISVEVLDIPMVGFLAENDTLFVTVIVEGEVIPARPEPDQVRAQQEANLVYPQMPGDCSESDSS